MLQWNQQLKVITTQMGVLSKSDEDKIQPLISGVTSQPLHNNRAIVIYITASM